MTLTEEEFTRWMKEFYEGPLRKLLRDMIIEEVERQMFQRRWNAEQGLPEGI